ncbi:hypothetical protein CWE21_10895 [Pseudidiomarina aquimaris]|uniref:Uncharacterized protein n=1 Tax=Pseudidiomarina aquimaris TaxID=641841 RepID=A0A432XD19_9GAMM|nr:hypothetical protein [Pseudidiomarina aquimaris]RUO46654.1 hypothetical protein CWE21_10895 [Pseudidiomarina aquimaris]
MPNTKQPSTVSRLLARSKQRLTGLAWRLNAQGEWHPLQTGSPKAPLAKGEKKRYLVALISRDSYQESWSNYTIRSARALKKVLELKRQAREFFYIGPWQNGKREVLTIRVTEALKDELPKAQLIFPETLVLANAAEHAFYHVQPKGQDYFLHKKPDGSWQTLLSSKLINSVAKAKLALGSAADLSEHSLNEPQLREALAEALVKLPPHFWTQGWQGAGQASQSSFPWQKLAIGLGSIGVVYLLISSLYLYGTSVWSQQRLEEISPKVTNVLTQQQKLQQAQQQLDSLHANLMKADLLNQYWTVVATTEQAKATLDYSNYNGEKLTVGGQSPDALELLRTLHALPAVSSAEFASPLRNGRGGQTFRIDITLNPAGGSA